ncbi:Unknown protein [Striga hermonthica]|uniref:Uncharacterized protein n=1 Tax=Striga hermonthica TaxID=68872 RepID=A0A9N7P283_STRHE|nr:Unknown protein [Striga hermonthica]
MPGTIQVTVLGFKGVSSSPEPSAKSLKVSMGKRQYQTWDMGEFSFPITKLGEDLVVALLDAAGNVITHADIRTMQIIEKGSWDEVFSMDRGGHVHMKLRFVLSEEERNKIRAMRESALKKKLETNSNIKLKLTETISAETSTKDEHKVSDVVRPKVDGSQAGSSSTSPTSSATSQSSYRKKGVSILESAVVPSTTVESSQYSSSSSGKDGAQQTKVSSNVKKMISAFENSQLQEVKSLKKTPSVPSQLNRLLKREDKTLKKAPSVPFRLHRFKNEQLLEAPRESDLAVKTRVENAPNALRESCIEQTVKELDKLPYDLTRQSSARKATTSGKTLSVVETVSSSGNSAEAIGHESRRGTSLKRSTVVNFQETSKNAKYEGFQECYKEGRYSPCLDSGTWIFADNTRRLCVTTAGKQGMRIVGCNHTEAKARSSGSEVIQDKNAMNRAECKSGKKEDKVFEPPGSECGSSPDDSSNSRIGQVVKIAVILGFGVFVLLTRQKKPRRKHREELESRHIRDYVAETTMMPWSPAAMEE